MITLQARLPFRKKKYVEWVKFLYIDLSLNRIRERLKKTHYCISNKWWWFIFAHDNFPKTLFVCVILCISGSFLSEIINLHQNGNKQKMVFSVKSLPQNCFHILNFWLKSVMQRKSNGNFNCGKFLCPKDGNGSTRTVLYWCGNFKVDFVIVKYEVDATLIIYLEFVVQSG